MPDEIAEIAASEIADVVEEIAAEIIEDAERRADHAEEIIEVLIDAAIETEENKNRNEFESRVFSAIDATNERLNNCQNNLEILQSEMTVLSSTLTALQMLSTPPQSSPSSESVEDLPPVEIVIEPENQQAPEVSEPLPTKRKNRLL